MDLVYPFLEKHWDQKSALVLALSGGPDSKALFYALQEVQGLDLYVAHVDHGWRRESALEAMQLKEEMESLGVSFHLKTLTRPQKNIEEESRKQRYGFFRELKSQYSCQAILLAHQKEDLAETVLKRVFEGAHLPFLGGMQPVQEDLWRPLLSTSKEEILLFLTKRKISFFTDPTNLDPTYLRSRMRSELFPYLEQVFGKKIVDNLALLSERAFELKTFLEKESKSYPQFQGPSETCIPIHGLERIKARYLLQRKKKLSRSLLEAILDAAYQKKRHLRFGEDVRVDQGNVYLKG